MSEVLFSSEETLSNWKSIVLLFLFVHLDRDIFEVKEDFDFAVSFVFEVAFNNRFFEVAIKFEDMSVEMNSIWLIQL